MTDYEENNLLKDSEEDLTEEEYIKAEAASEELAQAAGGGINWLAEILDWTQSIAIAVVLALIINQFLFSIVEVEGSSMVNTLHEHERLMVSKLPYEPKAGDIVIIKSKILQKYIVKRVIALPGQKLNIDPSTGTVTVDGEVLDEPYINETLRSAGTKYQYPITVPKDTIFVMGDNRNYSQDSRSLGVIPCSELVGKVFYRLMPFNKFGKIE